MPTLASARNPAFPYDLLWEARIVRSVANLTRKDGEEFMTLAPRIPVRTEVEEFPLTAANEALARLRSGTVDGAVARCQSTRMPFRRRNGDRA